MRNINVFLNKSWQQNYPGQFVIGQILKMIKVINNVHLNFFYYLP